MPLTLSPPEDEFNEIISDGPHISAHTFEAINRFTLLFSLFEAKLLDCKGRQLLSKDYAKYFISRNLVDVEKLNSAYIHFKNRYADSNGGENRYLKLCGDRGGKLQNLVRNILISASPSVEERLTACLYIAFRLRNNLFHGSKWLHNMERQVNNLNSASMILRSILHISRRNNEWSISE